MDQAQQLRNIIKKRDQVVAKSARVITITSGKGGVGKSNTAVNLAVQLQKMGKKVIIFDADFGLANVEVMFGAIPKYNLSDVIYRRRPIQDIITPGPTGIGFVSGGSGITGINNLSRDQIAYVVHSMKVLDTMADVIIVDTGAGISDSVLEFVLASQEILVVVTQDPSSLTDAYSLLKALHKNPNFQREDSCIKVVANRVLTEEEGYSVYEKLNAVVGQFLKGNLQYLGMVPQDGAIERAIRQQMPVSLAYPDAKSSRAFATLADSLWNRMDYQPKGPRGFTYLITNLLSKKS